MSDTTTTATAAATQETTEKKRIMVPYNAAGRLVFDALRSVGEKMLYSSSSKFLQ